MKKLILSAACAMTLFTVACSSSPEKQFEKLIDTYTTKIQDAKSAEDIQKISMDLASQMMELAQKYPDFNPEGNQALEEKAKKLEEVVNAKAQELFGNFDSLTDEAEAEVEEVEEAVAVIDSIAE
ncbi:MAG: hypothetical protein HDS75_02810 [Bacteroidales bacterium]|nr:hypothetical protein [Bacteroidales bacterium]